MKPVEEVTSLIPHRPPFLWVDSIISFSDDTIVTEKMIPTDLDIFLGHYPGNPIMPGVLLCEAIFQSGALLLGKMGLVQEGETQAMPVLTRINSAKFKRSVYPGDRVQIKVRLMETLSSVSFFKGTMKLNGKVAVQVDFACTMVAPD
jgi:3-hydroxyacyl-[acyl-carrier-protein] dehydratase